ncbi:MAG: DUF3426 domain-containing protein [Acetomicrobium sp.]|nr:DUF3426 domain-containing protein [Acetomicrobium sp.]
MQKRRQLSIALFLLAIVPVILVFAVPLFSEEKNDSLVLVASSFKYSGEEGVFKLNTTIKNVSSREIEGPGLIMTIYGQEDKLLVQRSFKARRVSLLPGEETEVAATIYVDRPVFDFRLTVTEGLGGG